MIMNNERNIQNSMCAVTINCLSTLALYASNGRIECAHNWNIEYLQYWVRLDSGAYLLVPNFMVPNFRIVVAIYSSV